MTMLSCLIEGCGFQTDNVDIVGATAILDVYSHAHINTPSAASSSAPSSDAGRHSNIIFIQNFLNILLQL